MAAYSLDTLLKRWSLNQLTPEQAIGQILQLIQQLEARVKRLEQAPSTKPKPPATLSSALSPTAPKEPATAVSLTTPTPAKLDAPTVSQTTPAPAKLDAPAVFPTMPSPAKPDAPAAKSRSPRKH
jgi:hypothetical protein